MSIRRLHDRWRGALFEADVAIGSCFDRGRNVVCFDEHLMSFKNSYDSLANAGGDDQLELLRLIDALLVPRPRTSWRCTD